ncbi:MAG TPA: class I SAM-dependent methyltransferase [Xenococcaceae cyanobacterium]
MNSITKRLIRRTKKELFLGFLSLNKGDFISAKNDRYINVLEQQFLYDRANLKKLLEKIETQGIMVEVGSLIGFSTSLFAQYFDQVYSIDPYISGYDDSDRNSDTFRLKLAKFLFQIRFVDSPKVTQYHLKSAEACLKFGNESLDFIYLDAGHTFEAVDRDIKCWRKKLKKGKYMAGDDWNWEGVKKAVKDNFSEFEILNNQWLAKIQ